MQVRATVTVKATAAIAAPTVANPALVLAIWRRTATCRLTTTDLVVIAMLTKTAWSQGAAPATTAAGATIRTTGAQATTEAAHQAAQSLGTRGATSQPAWGASQL